MNKMLLLVDSDCALCSRLVQFLIARDKQGVFLFAGLNSEYGKNWLAENYNELALRESVILINHKKHYTESTAAILILSSLGLPWSFFRIFLIIPRFLRDQVYRFIARNRHRLVKTNKDCPFPTQETNSRFLA